MADQRNFARTVMAVSSVVVAACAVAVTIKALTTGIISIEQPRVLDQEALERQVSDNVRGLRDDPIRVSCPVSVVVKVDNRFTCRARIGASVQTVRVTVISDQGELSVSNAG